MTNRNDIDTTIHSIYDNLAYAETGHLPNPHVRTSSDAGGEGSDAFGELQIMSKLYNLDTNAPTRADTLGHLINYTFDEIKFQAKMIEQTPKFFYSGKNKDNQQQYPNYDVAYDYSDRDNPNAGVGFVMDSTDIELYKSSAKKLLTWQLKNLADGDEHKLINIHRYGHPKGEPTEHADGTTTYEDIKTADFDYYERYMANSKKQKDLIEKNTDNSIERQIINSLKSS